MAKKRIGRNTQRKTNQKPMLFGARNYSLMGIGFMLLFLGFIIMRVENEIDGFFSLFIAPWIIFAGFLVFGYGILKKNPALESNKP